MRASTSTRVSEALTDAEAIEEFVATHGVTKCPPGRAENTRTFGGKPIKRNDRDLDRDDDPPTINDTQKMNEGKPKYPWVNTSPYPKG